MPAHIIYHGKVMTEEEYNKAREEEGGALFSAMGHFYDADSAGVDAAEFVENKGDK